MLGLLWLYSHSGLPQPDTRYSVAPALLLFPVLLGAIHAALRSTPRWRLAVAVLVLPAAPALLFAARAHQLALAPVLHGRAGEIVAGGKIDPAALRATVAARAGSDSSEVVWMCFQPSALYVLDGRHVFESYDGAPVTFRTQRPVTLVVLRDKAGSMHPSTYDNNYRYLDITGRSPEFEHGDYDVFIRKVGADHSIAVPATP